MLLSFSISIYLDLSNMVPHAPLPPSQPSLDSACAVLKRFSGVCDLRLVPKEERREYIIERRPRGGFYSSDPSGTLERDARSRWGMTTLQGAKQRSPESLSAIKHQQDWLDKLVREDELDSSASPTPSPPVAAPDVSRPSRSFHKTKSGLSLSKVLKRSQLAAAGSRAKKLPPKATYRTTSREKASLSQRASLDWLTLEHKHSGMSLQRQVELRALFERCADDPTQLQRHGLHAAALLKASGHRRRLNTPPLVMPQLAPGIPRPCFGRQAGPRF